MNKIFLVSSLAIISLLAGCASAPLKPPSRMDGKPLVPNEQAALVSVNSIWGENSGVMGGFTSLLEITKIDGAPVPIRTSLIQLEPGAHVIEYKCAAKFGLKDTGGADGTGKSKEIIFESGFIYYASVLQKMSSFESFGSLGIASKGTCWLDKFSTMRPK